MAFQFFSRFRCPCLCSQDIADLACVLGPGCGVNATPAARGRRANEAMGEDSGGWRTADAAVFPSGTRCHNASVRAAHTVSPFPVNRVSQQPTPVPAPDGGRGVPTPQGSHEAARVSRQSAVCGSPVTLRSLVTTSSPCLTVTAPGRRATLRLLPGPEGPNCPPSRVGGCSSLHSVALATRSLRSHCS